MRANCIICSDLFDEINPMCTAKCGHVYHTICLTTWVNQSKSCPYCRARLTLKDIQKIYFNYANKSDNSYINSSELENEISNLKSQLLAKDAELVASKKEKNDTVVFVREAEKRASELQQTVYKLESDISELRLRVKSVTKLEAKVLKLEQMNAALSNDLEHLNNVQSIVNGTLKDAENILNSYNNHSEVARQLATHCVCLKRELQKLMESRSKLNDLNSKLKRENGLFAAKIKFYEEAMAISNNKKEKQLKTGTPLKKSSLNPNENSPLSVFLANTPASSSRAPCEEVDISPLSVNFNKAKFNVEIKTSTAVYKSDAGIPSLKRLDPDFLRKQNDENSIVRTGYNGFGGHSNFINSTGGKKFKKK